MKKVFLKTLCLFLSFIALAYFAGPIQAHAAYVLPDGATRRGIDVSRWNGPINWSLVKQSNIDFAIIRTSFADSSLSNCVDKHMRENIQGAKAVGIPIGAYHYSYATSIETALKEADLFIHCLSGTQWEYPVYFDFEDKCQLKLTVAQRTDIACAFLERVRSAGYCVGMYANLNWINTKLDMSRLQNYELWVAQWNSHCTCTHAYSMWQYTDKGSLNGIYCNYISRMTPRSVVDMNLCYVDYPTYMRENHLNGF